MSRERADGLEDPSGCTDPYTGETVHRGSVVAVPFGTPMPPGSTPPYHDGSHAPSTSLYVCQSGRWVGVVSYRESAIQLVSDAMSALAADGSTVVMTGSCQHVGGAAVSISASVGSVDIDEDGCWTWQCTPDDGPADGEIVVITATADDGTAKVAFELTYVERQQEHP